MKPGHDAKFVLDGHPSLRLVEVVGILARRQPCPGEGDDELARGGGATGAIGEGTVIYTNSYQVPGVYTQGCCSKKVSYAQSNKVFLVGSLMLYSYTYLVRYVYALLSQGKGFQYYFGSTTPGSTVRRFVSMATCGHGRGCGSARR